MWLEAVGFHAGALRVRFEAVANRCYALEWVESLAASPPVWTVIHTEPGHAVSEIVELDVQSGGKRTGFVRLRLCNP